MSGPVAPPAGFRIGHWSDPEGRTGCTVVIAPDGTRGGVDVRGGGPGTRETDVIGPFAGTDRVTAVMLAGGSAYGLSAADGAMRWLEEQGLGYPTPAGVVPIVPAAIVYDLAEGDPDARPGAEAGYAACAAADEGVPERGRIGAGSGTAASKILGRESAVPSGVGYAAARGAGGVTVAALAVANPFGDVIGADGQPLAVARSEDGSVAADGRRDRRDGGAAGSLQGAAGQYDARLPDDRRPARQGGMCPSCASGGGGGGARGRPGVHGRGWRRGLLPGVRGWGGG